MMNSFRGHGQAICGKMHIAPRTETLVTFLGHETTRVSSAAFGHNF